MSFDADRLRDQIARHGPLVRVVVAAARGSVPREVGASMLVWPDRIAGTIGGGTLEHRAIAAARAGHRGPWRQSLGPGLGQCCGGAVTLHFADWDAAALAAIPPRGPVISGSGARSGAPPGPRPGLSGALLAEDRILHRRAVWIWGAGHVGRALAATLSPLPGIAVTWADTAPERFPDILPDGVARLVAADMPRAARHAPANAEHLIVTYSHEIDFALCDALLSRPAGFIGLIGSATKRARFRSRLRHAGHDDAAISRIACPIGDPSLGKHPQAIAVGVACALLKAREADERRAV